MKLLKLFAKGSAVFLFTFILLELVLRWYGIQPYPSFTINIKYKPDHCFLLDSLYSIKLNEGQYEVIINDSLVYTATHNAASQRVTSYDPIQADSSIWMFGCSMTYGMGVHDTATYPFLLQHMLHNHKVENLAIPGSGTVHANLKLKESLAQGRKPHTVILNYLDFHDDRNIIGYETRLILEISKQSAWNMLDDEMKKAHWSYAYTKPSGDSLILGEHQLKYPFKHVPLYKYSSVMNMLDILVSQKKYGHVVSERLIAEMHELCKSNGIRFLLTIMSSSDKSKAMESFCKAQGIDVLDISLDFADPSHTNAPYDMHPSPKAHQHFAKILSQYLKP
jgi:hypothetical protein